ncbi:BZ3500_MvSof-1268-A1-R1_Chr1-1g00906 [Microbotryum saponariae]|uniref:BZ3500_MvSof-1268-A1-R1_Chr1-1g00906 protein n=1 Tax=Microbotryum saponariae TaxID=289078 RepID=A0A2X0MKV8_9BASI|nr:BZ3500_MvSof-1268-A1-R1_Chr1-1g00906 [Microbotryum saponariae]SCZ92904.1 BZ3501_MvSof-1269-A2-R1_Chr1-1g00503 [Microbotryum saponariae]
MIGVQAAMGHGSQIDQAVYHGWPQAVQRMQRLAEIELAEIAGDVDYIAPYLPEQHRLFHTSNISFLPLTTKAADGRVWTSLLAGQDGVPGFISSDDPRWIEIKAQTWPGEPIARTLGSELETSSAVKSVETLLAGMAKNVRWNDKEVIIDIRVMEAMGNCPKYVTARNLESYAHAKLSVQLENLDMSPTDVLPQAVIDFIKSRDQAFLGTNYIPTGATDRTLPHMGCNIRGGRPGFIRVRADQRTIVLPDFSGNRHLTSLGNLSTDKHAGIVLSCFETGDVLYLTTEGRTVVGDEAKAVMPRARPIVSLFKVTGYTLVRDALPFRQSSRSVMEPSPYNPPIRYLVEEQEFSAASDLTAKLTAIQFYNSKNDDGVEVDNRDADLATFTFETSSTLRVQAGQYAVLDTTPLIGTIAYRHMSRGDEGAPNEDGVRTWTISHPPTPDNPRRFLLTMRRVAMGRVSSRFFSFGAYWDSKLRDNKGTIVPGLKLPLLGVGGTFVLPSKPTPLLLLAGGVGVTPFLAFLGELSRRKDPESSAPVWDVDLVVSTREPKIMLDMIREAMPVSASTTSLRLRVLLCTSDSGETIDAASAHLPLTVKLEQHPGRLDGQVLQRIKKLADRKVYLCGPPSFESAALLALDRNGVKEVDVTRSSFAF